MIHFLTSGWHEWHYIALAVSGLGFALGYWFVRKGTAAEDRRDGALEALALVERHLADAGMQDASDEVYVLGLEIGARRLPLMDAGSANPLEASIARLRGET